MTNSVVLAHVTRVLARADLRRRRALHSFCYRLRHSKYAARGVQLHVLRGHHLLRASLVMHQVVPLEVLAVVLRIVVQVRIVLVL